MNGIMREEEHSTSAGMLIDETAHGWCAYNWPSRAILVNLGSKRIFTLFASPSDFAAGNWIPTTSGELAPCPKYAVLE